MVLAATALADGLTFVEKDSIASVTRLCEILSPASQSAVDQKSFRRVLGFVCKYLESGSLPDEKTKVALVTDATYFSLFNGMQCRRYPVVVVQSCCLLLVGC